MIRAVVAALAFTPLTACGGSPSPTTSVPPASPTTSAPPASPASVVKVSACSAMTMFRTAYAAWLAKTDTDQETVAKLAAIQALWATAVSAAESENFADVVLLTNLETDVGHMKVDLDRGDHITTVFDGEQVARDGSTLRGKGGFCNVPAT